MKIIDNKLIPSDDTSIILTKLDDIGKIVEDRYIAPEYSTLIYLPKSINSLKKASELYKEISYKEYERLCCEYEEALRKRDLESSSQEEE